jgi:hypothetical protein
VQPVAGGGDNAERAAAAAQRPVQVGVAGVAGGDLPAVGQDDIGAGQVVQRQAVLAAPGPLAASQGEAGHADRRDGAGDRCQRETVLAGLDPVQIPDRYASGSPCSRRR